MIGITNSVLETKMIGLCAFLLFLLSIFCFTAGKKWKIIKEQDKRIEQLEFDLVKKEELLNILNIKLK